MNRLASETSPYLRQHADNPVDWYAWGDEAFARARDEDRPVLLSVGYSACHWCHVMAHESFEDPDVAAVMNRLFVNVKVDREERPDVDAVYMQAIQAISGHGGWPMTVFLTPDGTPFFGGTYFPKEDRRGMTGFVRVMEAVSAAWNEHRDELLEQGRRLRALLERASTAVGDEPGEPSPAVLAQAHDELVAQFDRRHGGFGRAPKFPQAMTLDFLLRRHAVTDDPDTLAMVTTTLDALAAGGIYDQVGGGFHRYSVDEHWLVPHFEKMLYDQALLVGTFLHGWLVTGEPRYRTVVEETIGYVLRDLTHEEGGWYSAEDADSEGVEGKFYLWSHEDIVAVCGDTADAAIRYYGVTPGGNFEDPHTGYRGNILHVVEATQARPEPVETARRRLFEHRGHRVRPGLDDKVLLGWNALFLRSLTEAAAALERDDWMDAARRNAGFLLRALRRADGRLLRSWQDGRARLLGYAQDYAALLEALLTLAELDDITWIEPAEAVASELVRLFADTERAGFFTTGIDGDPLVVRPKDTQDHATPAENSLAAHALLRLSALNGSPVHAEHADRWLRAIWPLVAEFPTAFAYLLGAFERTVLQPLEVAVIGPRDGPGARELRVEVTGRFLPASVVTIADGPDPRSPLLDGRSLLGGRTTAYVCERYACREPVTDPGLLRAQLDAALTARRSKSGRGTEP